MVRLACLFTDIGCGSSLIKCACGNQKWLDGLRDKDMKVSISLWAIYMYFSLHSDIFHKDF